MNRDIADEPYQRYSQRSWIQSNNYFLRPQLLQTFWICKCWKI